MRGSGGDGKEKDSRRRGRDDKNSMTCCSGGVIYGSLTSINYILAWSLEHFSFIVYVTSLQDCVVFILEEKRRLENIKLLLLKLQDCMKLA